MKNVDNKTFRLLSNRLIRLTGNIFKTLSYPFHFVFPAFRFTIPEFSTASIKVTQKETEIPHVIWQTNYTHRVTLPVYMNYLFNRLLSRHCDYHYVSTEARAEFLQQHATKEVYEAYCRLTDGAAQADLWRLVVLYVRGGVYMDIDATLVGSLHKIISGQHELFIKFRNNSEITNYFIASAANSPYLAAVIDQVVYNINHYEQAMGVYKTTGPHALNTVLECGHTIHTEDRKYICIQGAFTNEHFQYLDKPRGKWIHADPTKLVKK